MFQQVLNKQSSNVTPNNISPFNSINEVITSNTNSQQNNFLVKLFKFQKKELKKNDLIGEITSCKSEGNNQNTDTAGFAEHIIELNSQQSLSFKCENKNDNNAKILSVLEEIKILLKTNKEVDSSLKNIEKELSSFFVLFIKSLIIY